MISEEGVDAGKGAGASVFTDTLNDTLMLRKWLFEDHET